ncbi:MAG: hypothetical protein V8S24_06435 [Gordonibacter pamelaeae]
MGEKIMQGFPSREEALADFFAAGAAGSCDGHRAGELGRGHRARDGA